MLKVLFQYVKLSIVSVSQSVNGKRSFARTRKLKEYDNARKEVGGD